MSPTQHASLRSARRRPKYSMAGRQRRFVILGALKQLMKGPAYTVHCMYGRRATEGPYRSIRLAPTTLEDSDPTAFLMAPLTALNSRPRPSDAFALSFFLHPVFFVCIYFR